MTEIFIGERKCTNKGNDKQEEADSVLHNTTSHTQHSFKFQNPNCPEKSLKKQKCLHTHPHTNKQTHTHSY